MPDDIQEQKKPVNNGNLSKEKTQDRRWGVRGIYLSVIVLLILYFVLLNHSMTYIPEAIRVKIQLKWTYNSGYVGEFVSKEKGFWSEDGLEVMLIEGGPEKNVVDEVVNKNADFGITTGDNFLKALNDGHNLVAIALIYQKNPLAWVVKNNSKIKAISDFEKKIIGLTFIDDEITLNALIKKNNLTDSLIKRKKVNNALEVIFDSVDAFPIYTNTQGVEFSNTYFGLFTFINPFSPPNSITLYSNIYFARSETIEDTILVSKFINGLLNGWEFSIKNQKEASEIVSKYDMFNNKLVIEKSVQETVQIVKPNPYVMIGEMTKEGWESTYEVVEISKKLDNLDIKKLNKYFNNNFIKKYYDDYMR